MTEILTKIIHLASSLFSIALSLLLVVAIVGIGASVLAIAISIIAIGLMIYGISSYMQSMAIMLINKQWQTALPNVGIAIIIAGLFLLWIS